jgi:hypothetical protein
MEQITDKMIKLKLQALRPTQHSRRKGPHGQKSREPVDTKQVLALKNATDGSKLVALQRAVLKGEGIFGKRNVADAQEQLTESPVDDVCEIAAYGNLYIRGSDQNELSTPDHNFTPR